MALSPLWVFESVHAAFQWLVMKSHFPTATSLYLFLLHMAMYGRVPHSFCDSEEMVCKWANGPFKDKCFQMPTQKKRRQTKVGQGRKSIWTFAKSKCSQQILNYARSVPASVIRAGRKTAAAKTVLEYCTYNLSVRWWLSTDESVLKCQANGTDVI